MAKDGGDRHGGLYRFGESIFDFTDVHVVALDGGNQADAAAAASTGVAAFKEVAETSGAQFTPPPQSDQPQLRLVDEPIEGDLDLPPDPNEHLPD